MQNVLNTMQLHALAPAAFTEHGADRMSERYAHVNTSHVIEVLSQHGFQPVSAKQDRVNSRDPRFVRHTVTLRHADFIGQPSQVGEEVPQILLVNSHNGRTKLRMFAGMYRFVCSNGLVIGQHKYKMELAHKGDLSAQVADYVNVIGSGLGEVSKTIEIWRGIELTPAKADEFAREAAKLRFGSEGAKMFESATLLAARREADEGMSLWRVFNRLQENTTKGGLKATNATGRVVTTREIVGIGRDISYNDALWQLAEAFA